MGAGNKKGQIYNTKHVSKELHGYQKLRRAIIKTENQEPLGGKICKRRDDCVHYAGRIAAEAVRYDYSVAYDCPKDCKAYKKKDRHYQPIP